MGGSIGVESTIGQGSTFWFSLTLAKSTHASIKTAKSSAELSGVSVLIVDDNPTNRELLQAQLESWNMRTAVTGSGRRALEMVRAGVISGLPFDLIVLDMQMPEMSGNNLAEAISSDKDTPSTPMIMLSSAAGVNETGQGRHPAINLYLSKPVRQAELQSSVRALMAARTLAAPVRVVQEPADVVQTVSRVLVVEDNTINQVVAQDMLTEMGCSVHIAENGEEALKLLLDQSFDLIFMDCQMPVMDGYEATRRIRQREQQSEGRRRVPIIALTARAMTRDRERCVAAGTDDFLSKPYNRAALKAMVQRWLAT